MAKKKRRRSKPKQQHQGDEYFDDEENQPLAKGTYVIDDYVLRLLQYLNIRIKRSLFKDYGYQCSECEWATRKMGINGRNAIRAHSKKHKNEQRALNHMRTQVWLGASLLLAILLTSVWSFVKPEIPDIPTGWLTTSALTGPVLLGLSLISAYSVFEFQSRYSHDLNKQWRAGYYLSLGLGALVLIAEALLVSGVFSIDVPAPWLLSGVLPVVALAVTRSDLGKAKLRNSRRDRRSVKYFRRFIARTADGDVEYDDIQLKIEGMIRLKSFVPNYSKAWQWKALNAMGVRVPKLKKKTNK
jgi:hypothetical protein